MALTRPFLKTVKERAEADPAFRDALLAEGVDALLSGEVDVANAILSEYANAMVGAVKISPSTNTPQR
jgi:hypothetical protein